MFCDCEFHCTFGARFSLVTWTCVHLQDSTETPDSWQTSPWHTEQLQIVNFGHLGGLQQFIHCPPAFRCAHLLGHAAESGAALRSHVSVVILLVTDSPHSHWSLMDDLIDWISRGWPVRIRCLGCLCLERGGGNHLRCPGETNTGSHWCCFSHEQNRDLHGKGFDWSLWCTRVGLLSASMCLRLMKPIFTRPMHFLGCICCCCRLRRSSGREEGLQICVRWQQCRWRVQRKSNGKLFLWTKSLNGVYCCGYQMQLCIQMRSSRIPCRKT